MVEEMLMRQRTFGRSAYDPTCRGSQWPPLPRLVLVAKTAVNAAEDREESVRAVAYYNYNEKRKGSLFYHFYLFPLIYYDFHHTRFL